MTTLVTAGQMRAIERAAIESGAVTGLELMERAGAGAVAAILAEWPELADGPHRAVVLCGPGNNGGDGFVVARLLRERGWEVECFLLGNPETLPPDARINFDRWIDDGRIDSIPPDTGGRWTEPYWWNARDIDLTVDAIFGTGLTRPIEGRLAEFIGSLNMYEFEIGGSRTVALDLPSGLQSDEGRVLGEAVQAELTVAFGHAKHGHYLTDGPAWCGSLVVVDLGLGELFWHGWSKAVSALPDLSGGWTLVPPTDEQVEELAKPKTDYSVELVTEEIGSLPGRKSSGHKFDHGHALVLAGGVGRGGAARLAARAALRVGAGLVTVAPPPAALIENAARLDAIMLRAVRDADALGALLEDGRIGALCLGPGLGTGEREAGMVRAALGRAPAAPDPIRGPDVPSDSAGPRIESGAAQACRSAVLDGDALTILSRDAGLFAMLHGACVLTPHAGEFARLFPDIAAQLDAPAGAGPAYSKVDAAREAAARAGCTIVFKGPDTVIASPDGRAAIHAAAYDRAAPWLATAGSGDVLAGLIAGLLARGGSPFGAACAAAWLHVECALAFGPGLIAEDLPEMLPRVLARLEGWTPPG